MEQSILSLSQSEVSNILLVIMFFIIMSLISTCSGFLNGRPTIGIFSFAVLVGSLWGHNSINKELSTYYKSLGSSNHFYQSNFNFILVKETESSNVKMSHEIKINCNETESVRECLKKTVSL